MAQYLSKKAVAEVIWISVLESKLTCGVYVYKKSLEPLFYRESMNEESYVQFLENEINHFLRNLLDIWRSTDIVSAGWYPMLQLSIKIMHWNKAFLIEELFIDNVKFLGHLGLHIQTHSIFSYERMNWKKRFQ